MVTRALWMLRQSRLKTGAPSTDHLAHPTKSKVEFGCMGQGGLFDDLKIWSAEPVKQGTHLLIFYPSFFTIQSGW